MFRRYTSLFVVWFGLLSVIAPALTCAAAAQQGDCCPLEGPAPCGECPDRRAPKAPSEGHCVAPIVQVVAATAVSTVEAEQAGYPDSPDLAAPPHLPSVARHRVGPTLSTEPAGRFASSAASTYLVTGRLRL